jgi:acetyl-CoA carboxylase biotin carboxyl carrier protein
VLGLVAELLERLRDDAVRELEVRQGGVRVKVSKDGAPVATAAEPPSEAGSAPATKPAPASPAKAANSVTAPLTGIFYRSASAQAPPFVQTGTVVGAGDVIGLIEAMKLFNEVRSTVAGRVRRIVAENGQLVRAHQPLIELE